MSFLVNYSTSFTQAYTNWTPTYTPSQLVDLEIKALFNRLMLPKSK